MLYFTYAMDDCEFFYDHGVISYTNTRMQNNALQGGTQMRMPIEAYLLWS